MAVQYAEATLGRFPLSRGVVLGNVTEVQRIDYSAPSVVIANSISLGFEKMWIIVGVALCVRHESKCVATVDPGQRFGLLAAYRVYSYQTNACNEQQIEVCIHLRPPKEGSSISTFYSCEDMAPFVSPINASKVGAIHCSFHR